jgi:carbonic anhydrase
VRALKVKRLIVLGHAQCGGVRAMALGPPPEARDFVASWVEIARPALGGAPGDAAPLAAIEAAVVRLSLANLRTFPWVAEAAAAGRLTLAGFRFDIETGALSRVEADGVRPVE